MLRPPSFTLSRSILPVSTTMAGSRRNTPHTSPAQAQPTTGLPSRRRRHRPASLSVVKAVGKLVPKSSGGTMEQQLGQLAGQTAAAARRISRSGRIDILLQVCPGQDRRRQSGIRARGRRLRGRRTHVACRPAAQPPGRRSLGRCPGETSTAADGRRGSGVRERH